MAKTTGADAKRETRAGTTRTKRKPALPKGVQCAIRAMADKKASDVVVLDLRKSGGFTDFFVIGTGGNARHISAIADAVNETLRTEVVERPHLTEGSEKSEWILLDYFNFVVHIFSRDCRAFYALERLWGDADRYEFSSEA